MTRRRGVVPRLRAEGWILVSASIGRYRKLGIQMPMDTLFQLRGMCGNEQKSLFCFISSQCLDGGAMSVNVPMAPRSGAVRAKVLPMPFSLRTADAAEFHRLCEALPVAIERAGDVLRQSSSKSAGYIAADAEVSQILERITLITNELK